MRYYFAPMEGVTGAVYRRTHHDYFGIDKYFMPFITRLQTGAPDPASEARRCARSQCGRARGAAAADKVRRGLHLGGERAV